MTRGFSFLTSNPLRCLLASAAGAVLAGAYSLAPEDKTPLLVLLFAAIGALILVVFRREQFLAKLLSQAAEIAFQRDAFRENGERLRLLESAVLHAHDAVVVLDDDPHGSPGRAVRYVNDAFCRMTGYERADLIGRSLHMLRGPASDPTTLDHLRRALEAGTPLQTELLNYRKDGSAFWVELSLVPVPAPQGAPSHWVMVQRDVTDRREAEEARHRSEERLQAIFDSTQAGIMVCDAEGRFLQVNPGFVALIGYAKDELKRMTVWQITHPDEIREQLPPVAELFSSRRDKITIQKRYVRKDGSIVWVDLHATPVRDAGGRVTHAVGVVIDITERRRLEDHLRQVQKLEAIGQMAGGVAHDFNNLLTAALGNLALVKLPSDDPNRPMIKAAERAATRAADLTRKLLGYARRNQMMAAPVDPREVLDEAASLLRRTLDPRIELLVEVEPGCGAVLADATLLNQAVLNLCLNARDAMPNGGTLTLSARPARTPKGGPVFHSDGRAGAFVRISIVDTGTGMTEETKARLFEPFFTTKPVGQGTGLGLPMVQGIVKQHGGWIECRSEPGVGTEFDLYLPWADQNVTPLPRPVHHALAATPGPLESGSVTLSRWRVEAISQGASAPAVLLVDDEESIRDLGRTILENAGYRVLTAEDGEEAVAVFGREHPRFGLVILDMTMPRMSGRDAFREMVRIDPEARVLFSTGYSPEDISELDGSLGLLSKPYRPHEMLAAVRDAFGNATPVAVV